MPSKPSPAPEMQTLLTGLAFGESPRWHTDRLWFADWGERQVVAVDLDGHSEVMVRVKFPSFPMCFDWLPDGRLLVVSARDGLLLRREPNGALVTHTDRSGVAKKGPPWNEIVVDGRGDADINNAGFDFPGGEFAPGVIALLKPDGSAQLVADGIAFPNGMAVTPENLTLIVAESYGKKLTAFDIAADGGLSNRGCGPTFVTACLTPSALMPTMPSGTPTFPISDACEFAKAVRCCRQSRLTVAASLACSGALSGVRCSWWQTEWRGTEHMADGAQTGQILTLRAPARGVGWP